MPSGEIVPVLFSRPGSFRAEGLGMVATHPGALRGGARLHAPCAASPFSLPGGGPISRFTGRHSLPFSTELTGIAAELTAVVLFSLELQLVFLQLTVILLQLAAVFEKFRGRSAALQILLEFAAIFLQFAAIFPQLLASGRKFRFLGFFRALHRCSQQSSAAQYPTSQQVQSRPHDKLPKKVTIRRRANSSECQGRIPHQMKHSPVRKVPREIDWKEISRPARFSVHWPEGGKNCAWGALPLL